MDINPLALLNHPGIHLHHLYRASSSQQQPNANLNMLPNRLSNSLSHPSKRHCSKIHCRPPPRQIPPLKQQMAPRPLTHDPHPPSIPTVFPSRIDKIE
ncbi:hypothetical protein M441DRAFT_440122 [Trichoderma asperellum CBS 433.97]|uniref:Uncharacterized protein n=1 Tax=Trichoderma asperellum (strain ATCC 204424 / CBS 433.97 / NBRC 101777) TaxID=1042311 RepID=A0A2T3Z429_TRIA4|nr:hypothetical protein M441DRAFT_440122 [Trichoderma asperellum CBS 433.97]PTB39562.1 hypothetical protein M441DRAFT_440122 [Trichoderma asperellum CBS 433.97]